MTMALEPGAYHARSTAIAVRAEGLEKSYPGVQALQSVSFSVSAGEVRALLGKNGAGKSTLVKILSGAVAPDAGRLEIGGRQMTNFTPAAASALGVATVYQELNLVPELSVAENILLGRWHEHSRGWLIRHQSMRAAANRILADFGVELDPAQRVSSLSIAGQQIVEIVRGLSRRPGVLILDEPTSSLATSEVDILLRTVRALAKRGVAIIYVSHRMEEIQQVADSVTVLRDGRHIATLPIAEAPTSKVVRLMTGEAAPLTHQRHTGRGSEAVALEARNLTTAAKLSGIDLTLRRGEIVGLAGLLGSGRTELLRALYGLDRLSAGTVEVNGESPRDSSPRGMIRIGVGFAPEDRKKEGLVLGMSISDNLVLASMEKVVRHIFLSRRRQSRLAGTMAIDLGVKFASLDDAVGTLSGGNQQKVVLGKSLAADVLVVVLHIPLLPAAVLVVAAGAAIGATGGAIRALFDVSSFIVTLAMFSALRGAALLMTDAIPLPILAEGFDFWGGGFMLGVPVPAIIMLVIFVIFLVIATRTALGRSVYAIGGNAEASVLSGIPVRRIRVLLFAITGGLASITGLLMTSRLGSGNPSIGFGVEFEVITAVIVGGASLAGGRGSMFGTLLGGLFIGVLNNAMVLSGINSYAQQVANGIVVLVAVLIRAGLARRSQRSKARAMQR